MVIDTDLNSDKLLLLRFHSSEMLLFHCVFSSIRFSFLPRLVRSRESCSQLRAPNDSILQSCRAVACGMRSRETKKAVFGMINSKSGLSIRHYTPNVHSNYNGILFLILFNYRRYHVRLVSNTNCASLITLSYSPNCKSTQFV